MPTPNSTHHADQYGPGAYLAHIRADGHDVDDVTTRKDASQAVRRAIASSGLL